MNVTVAKAVDMFMPMENIRVHVVPDEKNDGFILCEGLVPEVSAYNDELEDLTVLWIETEIDCGEVIVVIYCTY